VAPLDNMAGFQLTLLENIARTPLTLWLFVIFGEGQDGSPLRPHVTLLLGRPKGVYSP
jgi:hypothetical protein